MTIAYRHAELGDAPFVISAWARTYKSSRQAGCIADEDWPAIAHAQIQKLCNRPNVKTIVAFENTDPTFLYGFIAGNVEPSPPVVHFVYVKTAYRLAGYARGLFAALGVDPRRPFTFTHWVPICDALTKNRRDMDGVPIPNTAKFPNAKHNPVFARYTPLRRSGHGNHEDPVR